MARYYLFDRNSKPGRWINDPNGDDLPRVEWYNWRQGARIRRTAFTPNPIKFRLKPLNPLASDHGPHMPSYLRASAPLFRIDLIAALHTCGVDNLETFPASITDPDSGLEHLDYKATNIVGLIGAVDMAKSNVTIHRNGPAIIDVDLDGFAIDESKTYGQLFFRLAESTNGIIVHESVCEFLLKQGFDDLAFYETESVAL